MTSYNPSWRKTRHTMHQTKINPLRQLYHMYKKHLELVRTERKLMALDDRMLKDIGLTRADIHDVIRRKKHV